MVFASVDKHENTEIVISRTLINLVKDQVRRLSLLGVLRRDLSASDISSSAGVKKVESGEFPKDHLNR